MDNGPQLSSLSELLNVVDSIESKNTQMEEVVIGNQDELLKAIKAKDEQYTLLSLKLDILQRRIDSLELQMDQRRLEKCDCTCSTRGRDDNDNAESSRVPTSLSEPIHNDDEVTIFDDPVIVSLKDAAVESPSLQDIESIHSLSSNFTEDDISVSGGSDCSDHSLQSSDTIPMDQKLTPEPVHVETASRKYIYASSKQSESSTATNGSTLKELSSARQPSNTAAADASTRGQPATTAPQSTSNRYQSWRWLPVSATSPSVDRVTSSLGSSSLRRHPMDLGHRQPFGYGSLVNQAGTPNYPRGFSSRVCTASGGQPLPYHFRMPDRTGPRDVTLADLLRPVQDTPRRPAAESGYFDYANPRHYFRSHHHPSATPYLMDRK